jgi:hypothetical protein
MQQHLSASSPQQLDNVDTTTSVFAGGVSIPNAGVKPHSHQEQTDNPVVRAFTSDMDTPSHTVQLATTHVTFNTNLEEQHGPTRHDHNHDTMAAAELAQMEHASFPDHLSLGDAPTNMMTPVQQFGPEPPPRATAADNCPPATVAHKTQSHGYPPT